MATRLLSTAWKALVPARGCGGSRPPGRLGSGSRVEHGSEVGGGLHAEGAVPAAFFAVVKVAVQGLVHRGAGEVVPVSAPALDAGESIGPLAETPPPKSKKW